MDKQHQLICEISFFFTIFLHTSLKRNDRFTQLFNHVNSTSFNSHDCMENNFKRKAITKSNHTAGHCADLPFPESAFRMTTSSFE